jgi:hypothetical protein
MVKVSTYWTERRGLEGAQALTWIITEQTWFPVKFRNFGDIDIKELILCAGYSPFERSETVPKNFYKAKLDHGCHVKCIITFIINNDN